MEQSYRITGCLADKQNTDIAIVYPINGSVTVRDTTLDGTYYYSFDGYNWTAITKNTDTVINDTVIYFKHEGSLYSDSLKVISGKYRVAGEGIFYFQNDTNLVDASDYTYKHITGSGNGGFINCTSLKYPPKIPVLKNNSNLYTWTISGRFRGCTSLLKAPEITVDLGNSTRNVDLYCEGAFEGCTALKKPVKFNFINNSVNTDNLKLILRTGEMYNSCTSLDTQTDFNCNGNIQMYSCSVRHGASEPYTYYGTYNDCPNINISATEGTNTIKTPENVSSANSLNYMYKNTGSLIETPDANTTYYTTNKVI